MCELTCCRWCNQLGKCQWGRGQDVGSVLFENNAANSFLWSLNFEISNINNFYIVHMVMCKKNIDYPHLSVIDHYHKFRMANFLLLYVSLGEITVTFSKTYFKKCFALFTVYFWVSQFSRHQDRAMKFLYLKYLKRPTFKCCGELTGARLNPLAP